MTSLLVNSWDIADVGGLWTGLTDAGKKGVYYWSDRSSLDYTSWLNTQPDERNLVGSCVQATLQPGRMNWLFWQDVNCNRTLPYACAMPPSKHLCLGLNTVTGFTNLRNFADMINEGLPGVLGNKGTLAKYRREQGNISQFLGTGNKISKNYSAKTF